MRHNMIPVMIVPAMALTWWFLQSQHVPAQTENAQVDNFNLGKSKPAQLIHAPDRKGQLSKYRDLLESIRSGQNRKTESELADLAQEIIANTTTPSDETLWLLDNLNQLINTYRVLTDEVRGSLQAKVSRHALSFGNFESPNFVAVFTRSLPQIQWCSDTEWERERRSDLELMLRILNTNAVRIDPDFDESKLKWAKYASVPVPYQGFPDFYPSGIEVGAIRDPAQRRAYEQRLEEADRESKLYWQQTNARAIDKQLRKDIVGFAEATYSEPPNRIEELASMLSEFKFVAPGGENVVEMARSGLDIIERTRREQKAAIERARQLEAGIIPK